MFATIVPLGKKNTQLLLTDIRRDPAGFAEQELRRLRLVMPHLHARIFDLLNFLTTAEAAMILAGLILLDPKDDEIFRQPWAFEKMNRISRYGERGLCRTDVNKLILEAGGGVCREHSYRIFYAIHRFIRRAGEG